MARDISFEDFKRFLENGHLDSSPGGLANILARVEEEHQEAAAKLALEWLHQIWRSEGAHDALHFLPPLVMRFNDPEPKRLTDLLFPEVPSDGRYDRTGPKHFWDWQEDVAAPINQALVPNKEIARRLWVDRCRQDPDLRRQVEHLAEDYVRLVEFASNDRNLMEYERFGNHQRYYARGGKPDCGHVQIKPQCDRCGSLSLSAWEAHHGWWGAKAFVPLTDMWGDPIPYNPSDCDCCVNNHDYVPTGEAQCTLCAEAIFCTRSEIIAREYGGWLWLVEVLRYSALCIALEDRPELRRSAQRVGLAPFAAVESSSPKPKKPRPYLDPWRSRTDSFNKVATFYVPVSLSTSDLKKDVQEKLIATFGLLWKSLKLKNPKSTGRTRFRADQWERYIEWLWRHRADGMSIRTIADQFDSPVAPDLPLTSRTIRDGIRSALRALSAI